MTSAWRFSCRKTVAVCTVICMLFTILAITPSTAFAETENQVLKSGEQVSIGDYNGYPVIVGTAKAYNYIGVNPDLPFYFSEGYFKDDSSEYNEHLSSMSMVLAMTAMTSKGNNTKAMLEKMGCENVAINDDFIYEPTKDTIGVAMAMRTVFSDTDDECTLIPIAIRGGDYGDEWINNFIIGEDGDCQGFNTASGKVKDYILSYISEHKINKNKVKILITGYSRGGAVANITGKMISDEFGKSNVFGYSFEPAMGADLTVDSARPAQYKNLHCITNYNDMVCRVAPSYLKFGYYGTVHVIGKDQDNSGYPSEEADMKEQLKKFNSAAYEEYNSPTGFTWAKIPIELGDLIKYITGENTTLFCDIDTEHEKGNSQRECIDLTLARVENAIPTRAAYASTIPAEVKSAASKINVSDPYTVEETIGAGILLLSDISDEQVESLKTSFSKFDFTKNSIVICRLYLYLTETKTGILYDYDDMIESVWEAINTNDREYKAISSILTAEQTAEVKKMLPTLVYTIAKYISVDYDQDKQTIGAIAYNFTDRIMQIHLPEINYSWIATEDSYQNLVKEMPDFTVPQGLIAESGRTLNTVALPDGFSWEDPSENVGEAGTRVFKAAYTPEDTAKYYTVHDIEITVEVKNAAPSGGGGNINPVQDEKPEAVTKAETLINSIDTSDIYLDSEEKIDAAREAYDALTAEEKKQVENYSRLEAAEKALQEYKDMYVPAKAKTEACPAGPDSIKLSWSAVDNAESYDVYRKTSDQAQASSNQAQASSNQARTSQNQAAASSDTGKQLLLDGYELITTVKADQSAAPEYTDKGLKTGTEYKYIIVAVNHDSKNRKIEVASDEITATPGIGQVTDLKLTKGKKSATVKWSAVTGAAGYKVYRSTKKASGFKCVKTIKGKTTKFVNKKLKSKKTYYFKVRAYAKADGKTVYGAYSQVKSVKIK